jgi:ATP-binding cassette subfamily B protein
VFSIYFYAILSGLVDLSLPVGVQAIIGFVMGATMVTSIYVLIFFVVIGVLSVGIMKINQMRIIEKIEQKIFARYAFSFAEKIPNLDLRELDKYYLPEKVNRFF